MNHHSQNKNMLRWAFHKSAMIGFTAIAFSTFAVSARATLVFTNGDFETTTNGGGQLGFNTDATGWTNGTDGSGNDGYNFLFTSGIADTTGVTGNAGALKLWGPKDGSANGLPASSPSGGNYIAADGGYQVGAISQNITGLTKNAYYTVGFWWAGAQQQSFTGIQTEQWKVSFGSQTLSTATVTNASHGFTGWMHQNFTFQADNTSDLLSFLAVGAPTGVPPFSLLDGVSVNVATPEPGSLALMLAGMGLMGGLGLLRRKNRLKR